MEQDGPAVEEIIEIRDSQIDPQQIVARIREGLEQRRQALGHSTIFMPSFDGAAPPPKPRDIPYNPELYHHLYYVNKTFADVDTEPLIAESPATRIPVAGKLWQRVRLFAHQLVLFYVNRAVGHNVKVNHHLVNIANALTADNQRQQREIADLQATVHLLRRRLEQLDQPEKDG